MSERKRSRSSPSYLTDFFFFLILPIIKPSCSQIANDAAPCSRRCCLHECGIRSHCRPHPDACSGPRRPAPAAAAPSSPRPTQPRPSEFQLDFGSLCIVSILHGPGSGGRRGRNSHYGGRAPFVVTQPSPPAAAAFFCFLALFIVSYNNDNDCQAATAAPPPPARDGHFPPCKPQHPTSLLDSAIVVTVSCFGFRPVVVLRAATTSQPPTDQQFRRNDRSAV